jgi:glycosyltransferase involved in cell wall biosynthesis
MIFIANNLVMNGGSTFLLRASKELDSQGLPCAVLILRKQYSTAIKEQLEQYATVLFLPDFIGFYKWVFIGHLSIFAPINRKKLNEALRPYKQNFHIMGAFGLIFANRLFDSLIDRKISIGIYHQNEFLYKSANLFFPKFIQTLFKKESANKIIFFNKKTKENYAQFFSKNYEDSIISPIGIELKESDRKINLKEVSFKIVSIGNLNSFKTYNLHMISVVAVLIKKYPNIKYYIYGDGEQFDYLKNKIIAKGLEKYIFLEGTIEYHHFDSVLKDTCLFVGSGTALLEAATLGIPSLIGIESIQTPETYGFLCDIEGFDYNEYSKDKKTFSIEKTIDHLFSDKKYIIDIGKKCQLKSYEFSISKTVAFLNQSFSSSLSEPKELNNIQLIHLMFSLITLFVLEKLNLVTKFSTRRNQSYL